MARKTEAGRRLNDGALAGAENMARDEALLTLREAPTLRFYSWLRPTLSLGYFQSAADLPIEDLRGRGFDVVRRSTGGKAILHQFELTYSLCLPETGAMAGGPAAAMTTIHEALAKELQRQAGEDVGLRQQLPLLSDKPGSAWCFEDSSPLDLVLQQRKLLGSAARRRDGWVLFHGSLVLSHPEANPGIAALGFEPDQDGLCMALGEALGYDFREGSWSAAELAAATEIQGAKYGAESFTLMR